MNKKSSTTELKLTSNERLSLNNKINLYPKKYINFVPEGLQLFTFNSGFKKQLDDLLIVVFDQVVNCKSVYSKTSTPSAPIIWDKKNNKGNVKALVVNSGNANAYTGSKGIQVINEYVDYLCSKIKCKKSEVLVSSTGVIGEIFKSTKIIKNIAKIYKTKNTSLLNAAKSIMTTDTYPKISIQNVKIDNIKFKIYGIAKGSGMIKPNMGTMLAYIFIEISVSKKILERLLKYNLDNTFNAISVDSDTSTSDTLVLFSLNKKKVNLLKNKNLLVLNKAIYKIMHDLSLKVIQDGEGLSKLIKVNVQKSKSKNQAKNIAFSIVDSPLVKTAIAGEDANWGRVIMAIGKSKERIEQNNLKIFFGKNLVCENGKKSKKLNLAKLNRYMKNNTIEITILIQNGKFNHTVYGNDLTYKYIKINADYRS